MCSAIVRPINWANLRTDEAEHEIRRRAEDSGRIILGDHAYERVDERDIPSPDVFRIIRDGTVESKPELNDQGEWEVIVSKKLKGERKAGVITIILNGNDNVFVKTVMWIDI